MEDVLRSEKGTLWRHHCVGFGHDHLCSYITGMPPVCVRSFVHRIIPHCASSPMCRVTLCARIDANKG